MKECQHWRSGVEGYKETVPSCTNLNQFKYFLTMHFNGKVQEFSVLLSYGLKMPGFWISFSKFSDAP